MPLTWAGAVRRFICALVELCLLRLILWCRYQRVPVIVSVRGHAYDEPIMNMTDLLGDPALGS